MNETWTNQYTVDRPVKHSEELYDCFHALAYYYKIDANVCIEGLYRLHSRQITLDPHRLIGVKSRLPDTVTSSSDESDESEEEESDEDQDPL